VARGAEDEEATHGTLKATLFMTQVVMTTVLKERKGQKMVY
jgi:hypothetical protein